MKNIPKIDAGISITNGSFINMKENIVANNSAGQGLIVCLLQYYINASV